MHTCGYKQIRNKKLMLNRKTILHTNYNSELQINAQHGPRDYRSIFNCPEKAKKRPGSYAKGIWYKSKQGLGVSYWRAWLLNFTASLWKRKGKQQKRTEGRRNSKPTTAKKTKEIKFIFLQMYLRPYNQRVSNSEWMPPSKLSIAGN